MMEVYQTKSSDMPRKKAEMRKFLALAALTGALAFPAVAHADDQKPTPPILPTPAAWPWPDGYSPLTPERSIANCRRYVCSKTGQWSPPIFAYPLPDYWVRYFRYAPVRTAQAAEPVWFS